MPLRVPGSFLTIHTGNLMSYQELPKPQRKLSSSMKFSDELPAAINYLARQVKAIHVSEGLYSPGATALPQTKKDVKRLLKVCPSSMSADYIEDAVRIALEILHLESLSELVLSFALVESVYATDNEWMEEVRPVWAAVESLVDNGAVQTVGVADLEVNRLRLLCKEAERHKPTICHYSYDSMISCEVPAELFIFADSNNIQLVTHDDPKKWSFGADVLESVNKITNAGTNIMAKWIAKYTYYTADTSDVVAKGYFVQFTKTPNP